MDSSETNSPDEQNAVPPPPPPVELNGGYENELNQESAPPVLEPSPSPSVDESKTPEQLHIEKMHRIRQKVVAEIVSTERTFVQQLDILQTVYIAPLQAAITEGHPIVPMDDIRVLFSRLEIIAGLNKAFLKELEDRMTTWNDTACISDIFSAYGHCFKMYSEVCSLLCISLFLCLAIVH